MDVRQLTWIVGVKDEASKGIKEVNESINDTSKGMKAVSEEMVKLGSELTKKVTLPLVGVGTAALKTTMNFDDGMSRVRSLTNATETEFEALREKAIQLGNDTAFSATEASEGMQVLAASGMEVNDILDTSEDMFNLMSAGAVDAEVAASVLTNTMAQFNLTAEDSTAIVDTFSQGTASAKLGVEELEYIMGQAGGTMASMNMTMQESVAMAGQLANAGMPIGQVGTALNAMGREIKANATAFEQRGIPVYDEATGQLRTMGEVMADVEKAIDGKTDTQRDEILSTLFSGQAMQGVTTWLSLGSQEYNNLTKEIEEATGATERMAEVNEDNIGGAFRSLASSLGTLMINIGDVMKGPVRQIANFVENLADKFNNLPTAAQKAIVAFAGIAAAAGPLLKIRGKLMDTDGQDSLGISLIRKSVKPTTLAVIAIVAAMRYLWKNSETFRENITNILTGLQEIVQTILGHIQNFWKKHGETITEILKAIWETFTSFVEWITKLVSGIIDTISAILKGDWEGFKDGVIKTIGALLKPIVSRVKSIGEGIANAVKGVFEFIGGLFKGAKDKVFGFFSGIFETITEIVGGFIETIVEVVYDIYMTFEDVFQGIFMALEGYWEVFKTLVLGAILILIDIITLDFEQLKEDVLLIWESLKEGLELIWEGIKIAISSAVEHIVTGVTTAWENLKTWTAETWERFKEIIGETVEWLFTLPERVAEAISEFMQSMIDGVTEKSSDVVESVKDVGKDMIEALKELPKKALEVGKNIMSSLAEGIKSMVSAPVNAAKSAASSIRGFLSGGGGGGGADGIHKTGLSRVPFDGYKAILHKNEEVLTADDPRNINNLGRHGLREAQKPTKVAHYNSSINRSRQATSFNPTININIEGNADANTVEDIEKVVQKQLNMFFRKLNLQRA